MQRSTGKLLRMRDEVGELGLRALCEALGGGRVMAEIGCYAGESTAIFAEYFDTVHAVDAWQNGYDDENDGTSTSNMARAEELFDQCVIKHPNIIKHRALSEVAALVLVFDALDFVYIDATHTYAAVVRDIKVWLPKIRDRGCIGGHDFGGDLYPDVDRAIQDCLGLPSATFEDTSWIKQVIR